MCQAPAASSGNDFLGAPIACAGISLSAPWPSGDLQGSLRLEKKQYSPLSQPVPPACWLPIAHGTRRSEKATSYRNLLLVEEFDKAGAKLVFVTESLDNSMEGQLLTYVRGWASKLEAVKIKERTTRGLRMRAL